jgi:hypothetical protein
MERLQTREHASQSAPAATAEPWLPPMSDAHCTIFDCPQCQSKRAGIIASVPPKARCLDCHAVYEIRTIAPTDSDNINPLKLGRGKGKQKRKARPGVRHRRDNGPQELEVTPVPPPAPAQLGTLHLHTEDILSGGPAQLLKAHHRASKLAVKYGEDLVSQWRLKTKYLQDLEDARPDPSLPSDPPPCRHDLLLSDKSADKRLRQNRVGRIYDMEARNRARVRYAMEWRPTFLAVVALSYEILIGCKAAGVSPQTVVNHRKADPDFDAQVLAAQEHCISLLHAISLRSAIEGDSEPVYWQGIQVGHIKKFDNRLRIELLRAHLPSKFKTPGSQSPLVAGDNNKVVIFDAAKRAEMIAARQEALEAMQLRNPPNGGLLDSGNSPGGVQ